ncbi:MAG: rhomboid family intramembrane serine protease [Euryarchaeota archaeon]|nr:rhomboid family intramembrane serine protease [Euryarchaeota archaeon]
MGIFALIVVLLIFATLLLGWNKRFSYVQMLIFGNLLIFFVLIINDLYGGEAILSELGLRPEYLASGERPYTLLTHMFMHSSFAHIIGNVLFLFLIGVQLEYRVGKWRTFVLYFVSGLMAAVTQSFILGLDSTTLMVGASGAIAGLVGALLMLYPRDKIPMLLGPIFLPNVPVILAAGVFLATQLVLDIAFIGSGQSGGVAYAAHLGGFVTGLLLAAVLPRPAARAGRAIDASGLEVLATTDALREELERIRSETEPSVREAWLEDFVKNAKCPKCGSSLKLKGSKVTCRCGYEVKLR